MNSLTRKLIAVAALVIVIAAVLITLSVCKAEPELQSGELKYPDDLTPYITLGKYMGVEVEVSEPEVTEEDIQAKINYLLYFYTTSVEKDGAVEENDIVTIDITAKKGFVDIEMLNVADYNFTCAASEYSIFGKIEGFADALIGHIKGDVIEFTGILPADEDTYGQFASSPVEMTITIKGVSRLETPELTDEFVTETFGFNDITAFRKSIAIEVEKTKREQILSQKQNDVWYKVYDESVVNEYPEDALNYYRMMNIASVQSYADETGLSLEDFVTEYFGITMDEFNATNESDAKESVKNDLVFYSIVAEQGLDLTDAEYSDGRAAYFADSGGEFDSEMDFEAHYSRFVIYNSILWDKMINFITDSAVEIKK
ncbi:MAG: hypothetical protein GX628_06715 [Clostridiales bacterium]|nr:hypothetical protein [Clostridiales bacterium]